MMSHTSVADNYDEVDIARTTQPKGNQGVQKIAEWGFVKKMSNE